MKKLLTISGRAAIRRYATRTFWNKKTVPPSDVTCLIAFCLGLIIGGWVVIELLTYAS